MKKDISKLLTVVVDGEVTVQEQHTFTPDNQRTLGVTVPLLLRTYNGLCIHQVVNLSIPLTFTEAEHER